MSKIAVMGDYDSIYGFASVGLETIPVTLPMEAAEILKRLKDEKYAVIYITEVLASQLEEEIEKMKEEPVPAVILIPGTYGDTGKGIDDIKKSVEKAVGSDILSGDETKAGDGQK